MNRSERRAALRTLHSNPRVTFLPSERSLRLVAQWQARKNAAIRRLIGKPTFEQKLGALVSKFS